MVVKSLWKFENKTIEIHGIKEPGVMCYIEDMETWEDAIQFGLQAAESRGTPIAFIFCQEDFEDVELSLEEDGSKKRGNVGLNITYKGIPVNWARNILPGHMWVPFREA